MQKITVTIVVVRMQTTDQQHARCCAVGVLATAMTIFECADLELLEVQVSV